MSLTNTIVTKDIMAKHSHHWQALLEWIADYLKEGPGVWWRKLNNDDIEFFDVPFPTNHPLTIQPSQTFIQQVVITSDKRDRDKQTNQ